ncbi:superoxide dismutase [Actinomadura rupiterrae]|uniref:superoxide dismutase n=1 Tax=Actinomadura rupiterrae TaxID=559627 RepID=UPI0020A5641E|nr:superoxide dismutase [Actinomadura rupiterrae]
MTPPEKHIVRRRAVSSLVVLGLAVAAASPAQAAVGDLSEGRAAFPARIRLPDGFQPEGITPVPGTRPAAFVSSMRDGSIYRADLRTGRGRIFSEGPGTPSLGLKTDTHGHLFVAGGTGGDARIVDTRTGRVLARYRLATGPTFVNDIILTQGAAWITDSTSPVLYKLPLRGAGLPTTVKRIPLTGDIKYADGFNANGITPTPDGRALLVVQSNTGALFRVDHAGVTRRVNLHGDSLVWGDGLLLRGRTLYALQNKYNTLAVLRLNASGTEGRVVKRVRYPKLFHVPATIAEFGSRFYMPNARFNTTPTPTTRYDVVAIPRP